ncbi:MAG: DUF2847 family protein [Chloroflexota bacterium]|nr:DUF2847 family protein [Chloroflexota bacterium]
MPKPFTPINDRQAFADLLTQSQQEPVILFKHDFACPISAAARRQLERLPDAVYLIDVSDQPLSLGIADQLGVAHQSPQVIVLRHGRPVWDAALYDISAAAVQAATHQHQ